MAYTGKIIGAFIGLNLAGPLGAIIGAVIGHGVDTVSTTALRLRPTTNQRRQVIYFTAVFSCLAKMAKADGVVDKSEINAIDNFMRNALRLDEETRRLAISIFNEAKNDDVDVEQYLSQLAESVHYHHELCLNFIHILHNIAMADGRLHEKELRILNLAGQIFRLPSGTVEAVINGGEDSLQTHYNLLECTPDMTDAQIKTAYRIKCKDNHPDHLTAKGMPEDFIKLANEKMAKINEAYEKIVKSRKN